MDINHKELLLSRITTGVLRCRFDDLVLVLSNPDRMTKYIANELYFQVYDDCLYQNMYFQDEIIDVLLENGLWHEKKEERLSGLKKDIDEIKCKLYEMPTELRNERNQHIARTQLKRAKEEVEQLESLKHCYDHITVEGVASIAKQRFIIGCSIKTEDGQPYLKKEEFSDGIIDKVMDKYLNSRIYESEYREIARTDPWLRTWSACHNPAEIFGIHVIDMNDEQKSLVAWSMLYDNVQEHPERPDESVLEDDDRLDGWIIFQKRKRELENYKDKVAEKWQSNAKIADAHEVFMVPESQKEVEMIDKLNDPVAKMMKDRRLSLLKKKGQVHELEMPDTKIRLLNAVKERYGKNG